MKSSHRFICHNSFAPFKLTDESIHMVMTSPPYPMIEMWDDIFASYNSSIRLSIKKKEGIKAFEKMHKLLDRTWKEVYRVLKPGGYAVINIGDATRSIGGEFKLFSNHSRILQACMKIGFDVMPHIIWQKPTNSPTKFMGSGMLPGGAYVTLEHEYLLILRKGGKRIFSSAEKEKRRESAIFWEERNVWYSDQWAKILGSRQKLNLSESRDRSAAFPIEIALRPILMYSIYGDTVFDPFGGTGTTNLAALMTGRNSVYTDSDPELVKEVKEYLSDEKWIDWANDAIEKRIVKHNDYCLSKEDLFFKYKNVNHDFPVKTRQEKRLRFYYLKAINETSNKINISYRKIVNN